MNVTATKRYRKIFFLLRVRNYLVLENRSWLNDVGTVFLKTFERDISFHITWLFKSSCSLLQEVLECKLSLEHIQDTLSFSTAPEMRLRFSLESFTNASFTTLFESDLQSIVCTQNKNPSRSATVCLWGSSKEIFEIFSERPMRKLNVLKFNVTSW